MWQDWLNGILGLVLLGVAFLMTGDATLQWTLSILGIAIAVFGFWAATKDSSEMHRGSRM